MERLGLVSSGLDRPTTILLVEDDAVIREMAREYLADKGYRVLVAGSGEEALQCSERESVSIDILVSDFTLPGENGRVLAELLSKIYPSLRILLISGYPPESEVNRDAFGAEIEVLQKPISLDLLARKIRATLDRKTDQ